MRRCLTFMLLPLVSLVMASCSSLSGSTRDAFAPLIELSQPETIDDVIVGGTNPYSSAVNHSLVAHTPGAQPQVIGVFAQSQAQAQLLIAEAVQAQCSGYGQMGPVQFVNGQWVSSIQCASGFPQ